MALRLLIKHKNSSIINIIGLSVSLSCALFILLWVQHELSYDRFHPDYKNLYRVEENQYYSNPEAYHVNVTPNPSGPVWKDEIPEILDQCRVAFKGSVLLRNEDIKFFENSVISTDSSYFQLFGFKLLQGNAANVLNQPNSVVISEEIAEKYFGNTNVIGKSLQVDSDKIFTITGVTEKPPKNTIIAADIIFSWDYWRSNLYYSDNWGSNTILTFVKLQPGVEDSIVGNKITEVTGIHKEGNTITFEVNPIRRIHLHSYFGYDRSPGAILYIYIFSAVALFVLIIACINFMNMSTARSSLRAKEIGLRKVNGASRKSLISQYLLESYLQTILSAILALLLVVVLLAKFNDISGKDVTLSTLFNWKYLAGLLSITLITGIMAGLYPAFYLSSFQPARAIKEQNDARKGSGMLRKGLVVFQFALSILLISGAFIVSRQLTYMRNADLGYNKEHLLSIPLRGGLNQHYTTLKQEFLKDPNIESISATMHDVYFIGSNSGGIQWPGKDEDLSMLVSYTGVDFDFTDALGIKLVAGRSFSEEYKADMLQDTSANFMINNTLASIINKDEIVGMALTFNGIYGTVVGIMEDYNFKSLREEIEPLAICPLPSEYLSNMAVRLKTENIESALKSMESTWNSLLPQYPFEYSFVDEEIDNMYRTEERMSKLMQIFTLVAVIIASMGLFALSSFTAERRTREIGIRKTFGAPENRIIWMMVTDMTKLILISLVIGLPSVWLLAHRWLADFNYRIDLKYDIFFYSALFIIVISILTVLYHSLKSARLNPVSALRYE
ncbi:ABC transporter permease [Bacteroidota bacterium]